jgi:hypothetical protein
MEDVNAIAVQNLKDHMGRIRAKMIARAIAKAIGTGAAQRAAPGGLGWVAGWGANKAANATEKADLRSWLLLPSSIDVARLYLSPGAYDAEVTMYNASGGVVEKRPLGKVTVAAGKTAFVSTRSF